MPPDETISLPLEPICVPLAVPDTNRTPLTTVDEAKDYASGGVNVSGFASGDDIDFRAVASSGSVLSWNQINTSSGSLSVSNGGSSAGITLLGNYTGGQFLTLNNGQTSAGLIVSGGASAHFASAS